MTKFNTLYESLLLMDQIGANIQKALKDPEFQKVLAPLKRKYPKFTMSFGGCFAFASMLHKLIGGEIGCVCEYEDISEVDPDSLRMKPFINERGVMIKTMNTWFVIHAFVILNNKCYDSDGVFSLSEIQTKYQKDWPDTKKIALPLKKWLELEKKTHTSFSGWPPEENEDMLENFDGIPLLYKILEKHLQ